MKENNFVYLYSAYRMSIVGMFLIVFAGTLCLGRAFSVQKLFEFFGVPFYITDVFIIMAFPLAFVALLELRRITKGFYWPFLAFLMMGFVYLGWGLLVEGDVFASRGTVLSVYVLFLPLIWGLRKELAGLRYAFGFLVFCNIISLVAGWFMLFYAGIFKGALAQGLLSDMRAFNFTLYYGMSLAVVWVYMLEFSKGFVRWFLCFICGVNVYICVVSGVRSSMVAIFFLIIFLAYVFRSRLKEFFLVCCIILFCAAGLVILHHSSFSALPQRPVDPVAVSIEQDLVPPQEDPRYVQKLKAAKSFLERTVFYQAGDEYFSERSEAYDNITWRIKVWRETLRAGLTAPFFGHGFTSVLDYGSGFAGTSVHGFSKNSGIVPPHNEFLTIFYRMGFLGLALFIWINGFLFFQGMKALSSCKEKFERACFAGVLGSFVVWHATAFFFDVIDSPPTNIFLWVLLGCLLVLIYGRGRHFSKGEL